MKYKPRSSVLSTAGQFAGTVPGKDPPKSMKMPVAEPLFRPAQAAGAETTEAPTIPMLAARHASLIDREVTDISSLLVSHATRGCAALYHRGRRLRVIRYPRQMVMRVSPCVQRRCYIGGVRLYRAMTS